MPRQLALNFGRLADQQNAHAKLARGQHRAFDFGPWGVVASHGIHSDGNHVRFACGLVPARTREALDSTSFHGTASQAIKPCYAEVSITSRPL
jgi:hypothetical protein